LVAVIRIHALGGLSVRGDDGQSLAGAAGQPRRMAVLALLARVGQRGMVREKVLSLLWPDADDERGPRALGQALYTLRRDLGSDEAIAGTKELRLDPSLVTSDVAEFASAVARGDDEAAAQLYEGPFLDGFHLTDSDEFSRWVERERSQLQHDYMRVLESLARTATAKGDASRSVSWWRRLAALDPLNARVTVGLMEALAAAGDRAGALQHARVYEALLGQELDLAPDHDVLALAARLRATSDQPAAPRVEPIPVPAVVSVAPEKEVATAPPPPAAEPASSVLSPQQSRVLSVAVAALIVLAIGVVATSWRSRTVARAADDQPVMVIGHIVDYGEPAGGGVGRAFADMLGTNLARSPGLHVVSTARMYELLRQLGPGVQDTSAGVVMTAARRAGATEIIEGSVYSLAAGRVRIDLRRIDIASGSVLHADQIEAADVFALADSGALRIVKQLGGRAPVGSLADVTTRSALAYRLYAEGMREFFAGDLKQAATHFAAALTEDSTFAMAAYYHALTRPSGSLDPAQLARAFRLSGRVSERERLIIRAEWAASNASPSFRAFAESLATRFPNEVDGHLFFGESLSAAGEFLAAIPSFERVVAMDSLELRGTHTDCPACRALEQIVIAYELVDSLEAGERISRSWIAKQPTSPRAQRALSMLLEFEGRWDEARAAHAKLATFGEPVNVDVGEDDVALLIKTLNFSIDERLADRVRSGHSDGLFWIVISLRAQGRFSEAMTAATRLRAEDATRALAPGSASYSALAAAQVMFERGQFRSAAALFDSIARGYAFSSEPSAVARTRAWFLTHAADARAAAGDTAGFSALADTIQVLGAQSGSGRDQRLHHHVRGLLLAARGNNADAAREFRDAVYSPTAGFTRTNVELARALVAQGKTREAIDALRSALHGPLDASNFYVTHTELHEMLARAWEAAGNADSAAAHYAYVARAWSKADAPFAARAAAARAKSNSR
jgi:DNA-binding SARP family transcriptional activator/TolB-like protein